MQKGKLKLLLPLALLALLLILWRVYSGKRPQEPSSQAFQSETGVGEAAAPATLVFAEGGALPDLTASTPYPTLSAPPTAVPTGIVPTAAGRLLPTRRADLPTPSPPEAAPAAAFSGSRPETVYPKIGFHVGTSGTEQGLGDWMKALDAAGVPFFLKSADAAGALFEAQELAEASGVPHTLVYRRSGDGEGFELPNYNINPVQAAREHWERHVAAWPPELDPGFVWMETINEPDKTRSEWLAQFSLETARLAVRDGRRYAAFGWSTGEPQPEHWGGPAMLAFLQYAGEHPDQIAIAIHEYSLVTDEIDIHYPFFVGRFQWLYLICDQHGIPRPTVLITEWGWEYQNVPKPERAMEHIEWANELYGRFPQVKGAAIWYLGNGWGGIAEQAQKLIAPVTASGTTPLTGLEGQEIDPSIFDDYYNEKESLD
ncbi:MAG: hypothetical protein GY803_05350 [Chloroflexi bacterium]|nr:hypothetical protein [Chloroflexota bacterium]